LPKVPGTGVDVAHHDLGLGGVGQERQATCSLDLVGDPVPVADGLQGNRSTFRHIFQEGLDGARLMVDPVLGEQIPLLIRDRELGIVLVSVASDPTIHGSCTFLCLRARRKTNCDEDSGRCSAFI
jgi:hypothetical protein